MELMVKLTMLQRLSLSGLISQQRGSAKDLSLITLYYLSKKIDVPNRAEFVQELPNGNILLDNRAIAAAPEMEVELERAEKEAVIQLLDSTKTFSVSDLDWILPLRKQLE